MLQWCKTANPLYMILAACVCGGGVSQCWKSSCIYHRYAYRTVIR